jgi:hypothetical protein
MVVELSNSLTAEVVIQALDRLGYPHFKGDFNLTLVGIRSNNKDANSFNDVLAVLFSSGKNQNIVLLPMTSDPGVYYRENPINDDGTAVLVPGHYRSCWQSGMHRGQYPALVQVGNVAVYRDNNHDQNIDTNDASIQRGLFGINLHRSAKDYISSQVDRWSAGCQVLADPDDFGVLMALVEKSTEIYGRKFSYTLLTEEQL